MAASPDLGAMASEIWTFVSTDPSLRGILHNIGALCVLLLSLGVFLRREGDGAWLPSRAAAPAKRACEVWFLGWGVVWIACFAVVIALRPYDAWEHEGYFLFMLALMSPLLLQPVVLPSLTCDQGKRLTERYSFKANLWIFVFGFVGNYWYTHYFYNVLKASYTFKSWDLNGVPIPMYFATHFYFCFYHTLSNMALRKVPCPCRRSCLSCFGLALPHAPLRAGGDDIRRRLGALVLLSRPGKSRSIASKKRAHAHKHTPVDDKSMV